jgi:hypothetical protein
MLTRSVRPARPGRRTFDVEARRFRSQPPRS